MWEERCRDTEIKKTGDGGCREGEKRKKMSG